jgi:mannosyltransferase OCH1-like enzyme
MKMCKEFNFMFFTDETIRLMIREHFPQYVYNAYMKINPRFGACLSDFGRYCLLYLLGGVYLDIKSEVVKPLYPFIQKINQTSRSTDMLVLSHWRDINPHWDRFGPKGEIMNWVIISSPHHPLIRQLIERMVERIESGDNGYDKLFVLEITGPILLTETIIDLYPQYKSTIMITDEMNDYFEYISYRCTKHDDCRSLYYLSMQAKPYDMLNMPVLLHKPRIK